jgi:hypothetical protein
MDTDEFAQESLAKLNSLPIVPSKKEPYPPQVKVRQKGFFIQGPIPLSWIHRAYQAGGGGAVMFGLHLWHLKGLNKGAKSFGLNVRGIKSPQSLASRRRSMKILEKAELIRRLPTGPGKKLQIEILDTS